MTRKTDTGIGCLFIIALAVLAISLIYLISKIPAALHSIARLFYEALGLTPPLDRLGLCIIAAAALHALLRRPRT